MQLTVRQIQYHRNGVGGAPFYVLRFTDAEEGDMLGVVFDEPHHVAVFHLGRLAGRDIGFGSNSWRGDRYEPHLRRAVQRHEVERIHS